MGGIKKYRPIVEGRKAADVGEADTVILVTEILAEVFGYDKFKEITSEFAIKGTYCDLATKIDGKSALMLVARLRHIAGTRWGKRVYLDMERPREVKQPTDEIAIA